MIKKLTIIGVGLLGGSFAYGIKKMNLAQTVVGFDRDKQNLKTALDLGIIDATENYLALAVKDADLILIAVPVGSFADVLQHIKPYLANKTIITDVGSTKVSVVHDAEKILGEHVARFVPGHPIAGSEKSGVAAAKDNLFVNRRVILTPTTKTQKNAITMVQNLWSKMGATVEIMDAQKHDQILALTSHLPHVLAFAFMDNVIHQKDFDHILSYVGKGFQSFTRIAAADPTMWTDICLSNSSAILEHLHQFRAYLDNFAKAIQEQNRDALKSAMTRSKAGREKLPNND